MFRQRERGKSGQREEGREGKKGGVLLNTRAKVICQANF